MSEEEGQPASYLCVPHFFLLGQVKCGTTDLYVRSNPPPFATENLLENTDGVLRPISVLTGRQPATLYLC